MPCHDLSISFLCLLSYGIILLMPFSVNVFRCRNRDKLSFQSLSTAATRDGDGEDGSCGYIGCGGRKPWDEAGLCGSDCRKVQTRTISLH